MLPELCRLLPPQGHSTHELEPPGLKQGQQQVPASAGVTANPAWVQQFPSPFRMGFSTSSRESFRPLFLTPREANRSIREHFGASVPS